MWGCGAYDAGGQVADPALLAGMLPEFYIGPEMSGAQVRALRWHRASCATEGRRAILAGHATAACLQALSLQACSLQLPLTPATR